MAWTARPFQLWDRFHSMTRLRRAVLQLCFRPRFCIDRDRWNGSATTDGATGTEGSICTRPGHRIGDQHAPITAFGGIHLTGASPGQRPSRVGLRAVAPSSVDDLVRRAGLRVQPVAVGW